MNAPLAIAPAAPKLRQEDLGDLIALARRAAGIQLTERKTDFLASRLSRRVVALGLPDFGAYRRVLREDADEVTRFVEALTTHTTSFFREDAQYRWLAETGLPELYAEGVGRDRELVFWSAACSTGQEAYSALIVAQQAREQRLHGLRVRAIGTDLSRPVLHRAATAVYSRDEAASMPIELRRRFLLSSRSGDGRCRIVPELRALATWRQANLTSGRDFEGIAADVVFIRNVLIYFDQETQNRVLDNVIRRLRPGGFLMTGHTEASHARRGELKPLRPSIYRKAG